MTKNTLVGKEVLHKWFVDSAEEGYKEYEEQLTVVSENKDGTLVLKDKFGFLSKVFPEQVEVLN